MKHNKNLYLHSHFNKFLRFCKWMEKRLAIFACVFIFSWKYHCSYLRNNVRDTCNKNKLCRLWSRMITLILDFHIWGTKMLRHLNRAGRPAFFLNRIKLKSTDLIVTLPNSYVHNKHELFKLCKQISSFALTHNRLIL